jgi:hypothetical protein
MTDYKKYSLGQVENFLYDAMSTDATPKEIYDVIKGVVEDNYNTYKVQTEKASELLALLNGHRPVDFDFCDKDDPSPECKKSWNDFWEENYCSEEHQQYTEEELNAMCDAAEAKDKVVKWSLPVEADPSGEYFVTFPDDLLEAADLKEGDQVEWIAQDGGSYLLKKITNPLGMEKC